MFTLVIFKLCRVHGASQYDVRNRKKAMPALTFPGVHLPIRFITKANRGEQSACRPRMTAVIARQLLFRAVTEGACLVVVAKMLAIFSICIHT